MKYESIAIWRGVACLGVVLFHSFGAFAGQPVWAPLQPVRFVSGYGWLGLHLFFVLSGYCIFERLHLARRRGESASAFWRDRSLRIFPVYWAALLASIALNLLAWPFNHTSLRGNFPASAADWFANLTLTHALLGWEPYLLVSWTLTCELAFYVIAGGLLGIFGRKSAGPTAVFLAGFTLCAAASFLPAHRWSMPLDLWPEFFLGACVSFILRAAAESRRSDLWVGIFALGALTVATGLQCRGYTGLPREFAVACAWGLLALHRWDAWLFSSAPGRALAWVGGISYSLYLLHVQLSSRVLNLSARFVDAASPFFGVVWVGAIAVALAGGWIFWRQVEQRSERFRSRQRTDRGPRAAPLAGAIESAS